MPQNHTLYLFTLLDFLKNRGIMRISVFLHSMEDEVVKSGVTFVYWEVHVKKFTVKMDLKFPKKKRRAVDQLIEAVR